MWFRDKNGNLVEIRRERYFTDAEYYTKICQIKTGTLLACHEDQKQKIIELLDVKNFDKRNI
tara:strand:- start:913 stop:1098 length:186 start_codon:yes stop_codon:yes gene_type:complete